MVIVACTPDSEGLGRRLAENLQARRVAVESRAFPDGESYLRFADVLENQDLVVVHSCFPQQDKRLMELLFMLDAAKELGAKRTIAVVPYLAYARQDRRFRPGEVVSNTSVGKLLGAVGTDTLLTVDVHKEESLKAFKIRTINVSAMPLLAEYLKSLNLFQPYILAPDKGAADHARLVASILGTDYTYFEKHRDRVTGQVVTAGKNVELDGRDAVILDDIISTGTTIANVARIAKSNGARKIIAACTHALLVGNAEETMKMGGVASVIGTDTIPGVVSKVSVATAVAGSLRKLM